MKQAMKGLAHLHQLGIGLFDYSHFSLSKILSDCTISAATHPLRQYNKMCL